MRAGVGYRDLCQPLERDADPMISGILHRRLLASGTADVWSLLLDGRIPTKLLQLPGLVATASRVRVDIQTSLGKCNVNNPHSRVR